MSCILGVDVGGTFTDLVAFDRTSGSVHAWKTLTTPADPLQGIATGVDKCPVDVPIQALRLGTTIATNALLERKGVEVAFVTTKGFRDVPFIQSGRRKGSYDITWVKTPPLMKRRNAFEVVERIGPDGSVVTALDEDSVRAVASAIRSRGDIGAVAVCLLFSYMNPAHEMRVRDILAGELPGLAVSISYDVLPRWKEYARAATTIADAYIKPLLERQVERIGAWFDQHRDKPHVVMIKSNGGEVALRAAAKVPINLAVSGPTGGVVGAKALAQDTQETHIITLDIGGTSTDCAAIVNSQVSFTSDFEIEFGLPVQVPMLDIRTFGAGGGSVAWIDPGGMLRVGPRSAGAVPGPASYGRGGTEPTVTDANLVLGRIDADNFLGGQMKLDLQRARDAMTRVGEKLGMGVEETALAVLRIVNSNMLGALRSVLTERGHDPRDFTLLAFGGAGPLHAADLMIDGGMKRSIVPNHPGQFSAWGFLLADARVDLARTTPMNSLQFDAPRLTATMSDLIEQAMGQLREQGYDGKIELFPSVEMRYLGQSHELDVPLAFTVFDGNRATELFASFNALHEARYGYQTPDDALEIVTLKVTAICATPKPRLPKIATGTGKPIPRSKRRVVYTTGAAEASVYDRETLRAGDRIEGPAVVEEPASVTVLPPETILEVDGIGNLLIQHGVAS